MTKKMDAGSVVDQINALVAEKIKAGMARHKAFAAVGRENPELREQYDQEFSARVEAQPGR